MEINEDERIEDLEFKGLKIIQNKKWFCFGIDSVLLSDFSKDIHKNSLILDLGAGNGILELLLSAKIDGVKITGIEVQKKVAELACRNIELNKLEQRVQIKNINIKDFFKEAKYDAVITNPPYKEAGAGRQNEEEAKVIARHEKLANLEDFIATASRSLKDKGSMYMVNRPERLTDVLVLSRQYKLEPKIIRFVFSKVNSLPVLFLIKATKNANRFLKVEKPLYIYEENGKYTEEILRIYNKERE